MLVRWDRFILSVQQNRRSVVSWIRRIDGAKFEYIMEVTNVLIRMLYLRGILWVGFLQRLLAYSWVSLFLLFQIAFLILFSMSGKFISWNRNVTTRSARVRMRILFNVEQASCQPLLNTLQAAKIVNERRTIRERASLWVCWVYNWVTVGDLYLYCIFSTIYGRSVQLSMDNKTNVETVPTFSPKNTPTLRPIIN